MANIGRMIEDQENDMRCVIDNSYVFDITIRLFGFRRSFAPSTWNAFNHTRFTIIRSNLNELYIAKTREVVHNLRNMSGAPTQSNVFTASLNAAVLSHGQSRKVGDGDGSMWAWMVREHVAIADYGLDTVVCVKAAWQGDGGNRVEWEKIDLLDYFYLSNLKWSSCVFPSNFYFVTSRNL